MEKSSQNKESFWLIIYAIYFNVFLNFNNPIGLLIVDEKFSEYKFPCLILIKNP